MPRKHTHTQRQTEPMIRISLSKLQHANIFFAFCFLQTQREKISRKKWGEKKAARFMLHKVL